MTELERSPRFYTEGPGLVEQARGTMTHGGTWVSRRDLRRGVELEFNRYPPGSKFATPYVPGKGLDHIGFEVEEARSAVERLWGLGGKAAAEPGIEQGRYWIGFVEDPDGLWVEVQSPIDSNASGPTGPLGPS